MPKPLLYDFRVDATRQKYRCVCVSEGVVRNAFAKDGTYFFQSVVQASHTHPFTVLVAANKVHCVAAVYDVGIAVVRIRWVIVAHIIPQASLSIILFLKSL